MPKQLAASVIAVAFFSQLASAVPFQIGNRTVNPSIPQELRDALVSAANDIETKVNGGFLSDTSRQTFDDALGRAGTSNGSALMADRASSPDTVSVGFGGQVSAYLNGQSFSKLSTKAENSLPSIGAAVGAAVNIGLKASSLGLFRGTSKGVGDRLWFYLSGVYLAPTIKSVDASLAGVGLMASYRLMLPRGTSYLARWGGITVGTGVSYTSSTLTYQGTIHQTSTQNMSGGGNATVNVDMNYSLGIKSHNFLVPFEVSTNVTVLYLLTLYGGASLDVNFGSSGLTGSGSGPVAATSSAMAGDIFDATAAVNLDDGLHGKPSTAIGRGFGGIQLNFSVLKVALEANVLSNGAESVSAMVRVAL